MGIVKDGTSLSFLEGVAVSVEGETTTTDAFGGFRLIFPEKKQKEQYILQFKKEGYQPTSERYYPKSGSIEIQMKEK